jgi:hypothetical protein
MQSSSGTQCYHCGKLRLARHCPHCGYHDVAYDEVVVCQRCGGVFRHGRCFQCAWSGEPVLDAAQRERRPVLGMFELDKLEQRLARKATVLGVDPQLEGPVADAVSHAFARAHQAPFRPANWISRFELMATEYLEYVARDQIGQASSA